jgi:hypothetical protein
METYLSENKAVTLINLNGIKVECHQHAPKVQPMVCSIEAKTIEEVLVVCEYPDGFPKELPRMHQIEIWNLLLTWYLELLQ